MKLLLVFLFFIHYLSAFDLDKIKSHIDKKFAEAQVEIYPYPHIIIEDILPNDLYDELEKNLPNSVSTSNLLPYDTRNIWYKFCSLISDQILKKKIVDAFRPYTKYKFGVNITDMCFCNAENISEHRLVENYQISPHVDQGYIFAPVFIYMPRSNSDDPELGGTYMFKHLSNREEIDVQYVPEKEVRVVKIAPYKKNTLFTFMRTPNSWHGSYQHAGVYRRFYLSCIYLTHQAMDSWYHTDFSLKSRTGYVLNEKDLY